MPRLVQYGSISEGGRKKITLEEILSSCPDEHSRRLFDLLQNTWINIGNQMVPATVGASFRALVDRQGQPIFWAYPDSLQAAFSVLLKAGAPTDNVERYRSAVAAISGFNTQKVLKESQPITKWSSLTDDAIRAFVSESQLLVDAWRKSTTPRTGSARS